MTDQQIETRVVEGRAVCAASAAQCHCVKDFGHIEAGDSVHACNPNECTGQWSGDLDGPDFKVVEFPTAVIR